MKAEAQRIAILTACGWTDLSWQDCPSGRHLFGYPKEFVRPDEAHIDFAGLRMTLNQVAKKHAPDPISDLNACHEMEKVLTPAQWETYTQRVWDVCRRTSESFVPLHATAPQRCEAFLKTLNLWSEE